MIFRNGRWKYYVRPTIAVVIVDLVIVWAVMFGPMSGLFHGPHAGFAQLMLGVAIGPVDHVIFKML